MVWRFYITGFIKLARYFKLSGQNLIWNKIKNIKVIFGTQLSQSMAFRLEFNNALVICLSINFHYNNLLYF